MALKDLSEEQILKSDSNALISRYSNLGSNTNRGTTARSLFYEAGKRNPGKYGQFLFYSLGSFDNNYINSYYRSESVSYNKTISSLASKNPSAGMLVRETQNNELISSKNTGTLSGLVSSTSYTGNIIGGLSAPYYWKDFLYCKYYGAIPNNYMITLRRFPTPVLDNLSVPDAIKSTDSYHAEGAGRPVAQAVTWYGGNTGNSLSSLLSFTSGLQWQDKEQEQTRNQQAFSKGIFMDGAGPMAFIGDSLKKLSPVLGNAFDLGKTLVNGLTIAADPRETVTGAIRTNAFRNRSKEESGVMGEYIYVPVDVVKKTWVRGMGLTFAWGEINVVFEYELATVSEVNSKAAMLDILGNLLSIGTNYGNFLTPDVRYDAAFPPIGFPGGNAGLETYYKDPLKWFKNFATDITKSTKGTGSTQDSDPADTSADSKIQDIRSKLSSILQESGNDPSKISSQVDKLAEELGAGAGRLLRFAVSKEFTENYKVPVSLLTGAPVGEWHLTVGNPTNPIAMIGNLICNGVKIEFSESLGPDDFPTGIKATFTLTHGRDRERGEIESIFNRGAGRLYQSTLSTSANAQPYASFGDVNGNVLSENFKNDYLDGTTWQKNTTGL